MIIHINYILNNNKLKKTSVETTCRIMVSTYTTHSGPISKSCPRECTMEALLVGPPPHGGHRTSNRPRPYSAAMLSTAVLMIMLLNHRY